VLFSEEKNIPYRIFQQLLETALYVLAPLGSDQQVNVLQAGTRPEQLLDQSLAHEPRATGDEHGRAVVEVHHLPVSGGRIPVLATEIVVVVGHLIVIVCTEKMNIQRDLRCGSLQTSRLDLVYQ